MARKYFVVPVELSKSAGERKGARDLNPDAHPDAPRFFVCLSKMRTDNLEQLKCQGGAKIVREYGRRVLLEQGTGHTNLRGALTQVERLVNELRANGNWVLNKPWRKDRSVYVIRLDQSAAVSPPATKKSPKRDPLLPCYYVGETGKTPEERFRDHKRGHKSNKQAREYGIGLAMEVVPAEFHKKLTRRDALKVEADLAEQLRSEGCTVFGGT